MKRLVFVASLVMCWAACSTTLVFAQEPILVGVPTSIDGSGGQGIS